MIGSRTAGVTYVVVDPDGLAVRTVPMDRGLCTPLLRGMRLLEAMSGDVGGYPLALQVPETTGLVLFAADPLVCDGPFNPVGSRLVFRLGGQTTLRGALTVCAVEDGCWTSLSRRQLKSLRVLTGTAPERGRWLPPGGLLIPAGLPEAAVAA